jgi:hypothetical protein
MQTFSGTYCAVTERKMILPSNGGHLITTRPTVTRCGRCRRTILAATIGGIDRHIEPTTLNDLGELAALVAGKTTYDQRSELIIRRGVDKLRQPRHPHVPVLADHDCQPVPEEYVDQSHMYLAMALVATKLGATLVSDTAQRPPF